MFCLCFFSFREYPCDHYTAIINVTLMNTGCPRTQVHETALQLLQILDKRFFGNVGPLVSENDTGGGKWNVFRFFFFLSFAAASGMLLKVFRVDFPSRLFPKEKLCKRKKQNDNNNNNKNWWEIFFLFVYLYFSRVPAHTHTHTYTFALDNFIFFWMNCKSGEKS